jgi:endonuclease YncB( thermonuclease family)
MLIWYTDLRFISLILKGEDLIRFGSILLLSGLVFFLLSGCQSGALPDLEDNIPEDIRDVIPNLEEVEALLTPATPIFEGTLPVLDDVLPARTMTSSWKPSPQTAACLPSDAAQQTGTVIRVIDGDTVDVRLEDDSEARVRYIGVDTPERGDLFYREASEFNRDLVEGRKATLYKDVSETDRFGRLLRYVLVENVFVNFELVRQGYASSVTFPPDVACQETFAEAERNARRDGAGLWGNE